MSIKLHCEHCGKKIEAPDNAGGKWGKCPACRNKVYVPELLADDEDELKLAPIDEDEERRKQQLRRETIQLNQDILEEKNIPEAGPALVPTAEINEEALTKHIVRYLRQMADGNLDDAQRTADLIVPHRRRALLILEQIAQSPTPEPALQDIPPQVLSGFIRNMRTRMS